ncbi:MAG TPA: hypothetical protein VKF35_15285, partial [Hyphomicrobiaceae bacterium]|nr:hypothetical protein [Hyphomicrobiaceae bacterium]
IIQEGLQRHRVDIGAVLISGKGPDVKNQEAGRYVQRLCREEGDESGTSGPLSRPKLIVRGRWQLKDRPDTQTMLSPSPNDIGFVGEKNNSGVRSPRPNSVRPISGPAKASAARSSGPERKGG